MSTVPTPFIGGSGGPPASRPGHESLEPPFVVDRERMREQAEVGVETTPTAREPEERRPEPEPMAPPAEEVAIADLAPPAKPSRSEGEVLIDEVFREFPGEGGPEPAQEPSSPTPGAPETVEPVETDDAGMPDFLAGADGVGPDLEAAEPPSGEAVGPSDDVSSEAQELLQGELGDRIRKLAAELGITADDETVSRAFAAGYLAAKREEQE